MKQFSLKSAVILVGVFYAFNEFGELYFEHQDARYGLNVACSLLHE